MYLKVMLWQEEQLSKAGVKFGRVKNLVNMEFKEASSWKNVLISSFSQFLRNRIFLASHVTLLKYLLRGLWF